MLTSLAIKNFALIEDVSLPLGEHLSIITGETGAGKSILLGALSLLLGKRADLSTVRDSKKKCVVEGVFSIQAYTLEAVFEANDLDYEPETIIRREILPSGKSRAFINDSPVKLDQLAVLGNRLVDIHSQHETLFVGSSAYQFQVIDALAGNTENLRKFRKNLDIYRKHLQELENLKSEQQEAKAAYDYHKFLWEELQAANLQEGMQEELEAQYQELSNVEELKENLSASLHYLQQEEIGAIGQLQEIKNRFSPLTNYGENYKNLHERLQGVLLEVEDMAQEMDRLQENVEDDPEKLTMVNDSLQQIYALQKKHSLGTVGELLQLQAALEEKVRASENAEQDLSALQQKIDQQQKHTQKIAEKISKTRQKAIPGFVKEVEEILAEIGMPHARLKIELNAKTDFDNHGKDAMHWLFSANKGGNFNELKKAASGGELSRITLAIKSILSSYSQLPTIVFDEIDTGVSGDIAQKMGDIMKKMGASMQVISITHLPQIAAKGESHFKVYKETENGTTQTNLKKLSTQERIKELAEMLGGNEQSASAMAHAKALLG